MSHLPGWGVFPFKQLRRMMRTAFILRNSASFNLSGIALFLLISPVILTAGPLFQKAKVFRSGALTANDVAVGAFLLELAFGENALVTHG